MNYKILGCAFTAALLLASCKKELMPQDSSDTPRTATQTATPTVPGQTVTLPQQPGQPQTVQATPVAQPTQTVAPGMNPPHGQPGHRCDIAVGAPLNSPKGAAAATPTAGKPAVTMTPAPVKTAPGMNPPHGQPGHRCDIAVGAPLSSAPAKAGAATVTPVATPAPTQAPSTTPNSLQPETAPVKTE